MPKSYDEILRSLPNDVDAIVRCITFAGDHLTTVSDRALHNTVHLQRPKSPIRYNGAQ